MGAAIAELLNERGAPWRTAVEDGEDLDKLLRL
jgi:hypothetical protein